MHEDLTELTTFLPIFCMQVKVGTNLYDFFFYLHITYTVNPQAEETYREGTSNANL